MHKLKKRAPLRNNRGISIIFLVIVLAIIQLTIDFFVFNLVRILMIERQINGVCEAASLAGTSILTKLDVSDDENNQEKLAIAQKAACRCAENMILRGHILGQVIDKAIDVAELAELGKNLKPDFCQYFVTVADPTTNYTPVSFGDPSGRTISAYIVYGYRPIFLGFLGNLCYAITGNCVSGLPQIDTVLVLDLSASMDDETAVTFVRREWVHSHLGEGSFAAGNVETTNQNSSGCGIVQYVSLYCPSLPHTLANYLGWDHNAGSGDEAEIADGSLVNVLPPQNLDKAANEPHGAITHPMYFDAFLRSHYSHYDSKIRYLPWEGAQSLSSRTCDYGTPPGNCDLSVALGGNGDGQTDLAGNLATPLGPAAVTSRGNSIPGRGMQGPSLPQNTPVNVQASPQINAFSDLTWQYDGNNYLAYQPAAPGALHGLGQNDPVPSPDQQTFTDLVVNIADPQTASANAQPLRGPDYFMGFSYTFPADEPDALLRNQTYNFANIGVVVEAARGNLESTPASGSSLKNAQGALIDRPVSVDGTIFNMNSISLKDGYQRAYQRLAMLFTQPLGSVLVAIDQGYLQKLHKFADCRFGFVAFSSAGTLTTSDSMHTFGTLNDSSAPTPDERSFYIFTSPYGNPAYSNAVFDCGSATASGLNNYPVQGGTGHGFRIPRIPLSVNAEQYLDMVSKSQITEGEPNTRSNNGSGANGIYTCRAQSVTDSGEALQTALNMFHLGNSGQSRPSASKLIVFFTDGEPTGGISGQQAQQMLQVSGQGNGSSSGNTCAASGVAITTVSLNLAQGKTYSGRKEHQLMLLDDKQPDSGQGGGIAWRAGHGGRYYPCDNLSNLKSAFSDIATHLSQNQR